MAQGMKNKPLSQLQVLDAIHVFIFVWFYYTNFNVGKQFLDDYEDNPDEDFGDNEMNATKSRKYVSAREYYAFKTAGLEEAF